MNILHIIVSGSWAGTENITFSYLNGLSKNHNVAVVVKENGKFSKKFYQEKLSQNVQLITLKDISDLTSINKKINKELAFVPDIIHAHLSLGCRIARTMKKASNIIIAHMHMRFYAIQFSEFDALVAVSSWQLKDIPRWYEGYSKVIPNFNQELKSVSFDQLERFKRRIYFEEDEYIIGTVCRLHIEKGIDTLINAFIKANIPKSKLVIIGDGIHLNYFKKLALGHNNIYFIGFLDDAYKYMKVFNLYISPSRADSFGLSTLEAIEQGIPVLASDTFGSKDILKGYEEFLFKIANEHELCIKILNMYNNKKLSKKHIDISLYNSTRSLMLLEKYYEDLRLAYQFKNKKDQNSVDSSIL